MGVTCVRTTPRAPLGTIRPMSETARPEGAYALLAEALRRGASQEDAATGFAGVAYSGGVVPNYSWHGDMAIDLASMTLPSGEISVLRNHDEDQIVGRCMVVNTGTELLIQNGRFSAATPAGIEAAALMAEGHPWKLSIGFNAKTRSSDGAELVRINGREMKVNTVLSSARLLEVSFVPAGADPGAHAVRMSARWACSTPHQETAKMAEDTNTTAALQADNDALRTQLTALQAQLATQARDARLSALGALCTELGRDVPKDTAPYLEMSAAAFAAYSADLRAAKPTLPGALGSEQATSGADADAGAGVGTVTFSAAAGARVEPDSLLLHSKIIAHQRAHPGTSYVDALAHVV